MGDLPPIEVVAEAVALRSVGALPRIGLILLATDLTTERDVARLIEPDEAGVHATRVAYANPTTPANLRAMAPRLGEAAALLAPGEPLAAICFGCTSASVVIG
jgi:maleate isomerase